MLIDGDCLLCNQEQETIDHLFFKCEYLKWVIKEVMEASGALVRMETMGSLENAARELGKITEGLLVWDLQWSMLGIALFHIWKQRNHRRMQGKSDTRQHVLRQCTEMTGIGFDERRFKRKCKTANEERVLFQWDVLK